MILLASTPVRTPEVDAAQSGQTLLGPDTAQRQRPAEQDREHAGDDARRAVLLAPLDQQPQQRQQRRDEDEIERRAASGCARAAPAQPRSKWLEVPARSSLVSGVFRPGRALCAPGAGWARACGGAGPFWGAWAAARRAAAAPARKTPSCPPRWSCRRRAVRPGGCAGRYRRRAGTVVFVKHRKSHSFWWVSLTTREQWSARRGPADRWPTGLPPGASRSDSQMWSGQGESTKRAAPSCTLDVDGEVAGVHIVVGVRLAGEMGSSVLASP